MILKVIDIFLNQKKKRYEKSLINQKKSLNFKKPRNNINTIYYEDLNSDKELNVEDADDDKYRKIRSVRRLFEESNYYEPKVINRGFAGEVNNYIKHISEGDKDEKLSPGEYLNMIKPDLRDLINRHKPIEIIIIIRRRIMIIIIITIIMLIPIIPIIRILIIVILIIVIIIILIPIIIIIIIIITLILENGKLC